jgi:hypothetical protein
MSNEQKHFGDQRELVLAPADVAEACLGIYGPGAPVPSEESAADRPNPGCVIKVGNGRGFIVENGVEPPPLPLRLAQHGLGQVSSLRYRLIVTAAHCLPYLPPAHGAAYSSERAYTGLLGSLDGSKKDVWAECLFVNPVADVAVLGSPDEQQLPDKADAYSALTDDAPILRIDNAKSETGWVLALDGRWVRTNLEVFHGMGGTSLSIDPTDAGMSGSPILNDAGLAVGVVALGAETVGENGEHKDERVGPQPILVRDLPGWLLHGQMQL